MTIFVNIHKGKYQVYSIKYKVKIKEKYHRKKEIGKQKQ